VARVAPPHAARANQPIPRRAGRGLHPHRRGCRPNHPGGWGEQPPTADATGDPGHAVRAVRRRTPYRARSHAVGLGGLARGDHPGGLVFAIHRGRRRSLATFFRGGLGGTAGRTAGSFRRAPPPAAVPRAHPALRRTDARGAFRRSIHAWTRYAAVVARGTQLDASSSRREGARIGQDPASHADGTAKP
jgi:hypothetical protein